MSIVELLIVIAVIGLLGSVAFPLLNKASGEARKVKCASNLRQLFQGMEAFAFDNSGQYPEAYDGKGTYPYQLRDYLQLPSGLWGGDPAGKAPTICPALVARTKYTGAQSYGINKRLYPDGLGKVKLRKSTITQPSKTILLGDATFDGRNTASTINSPVGELPGTTINVRPAKLAHANGGANLLFCDGHVEYWPDVYKLNESRYYSKGPDDIWNPEK